MNIQWLYESRLHWLTLDGQSFWKVQIKKINLLAIKGSVGRSSKGYLSGMCKDSWDNKRIHYGTRTAVANVYENSGENV